MAHAERISDERRAALEEAENRGPTYAPSGYGPPSKEALDAVPWSDR
jgi:hypothetical protein